MSFTAAKEVCSEAELNRFACAFLNCKDVLNAIDWDAAAQQYDPAVETQSFRTFIQRAMKKINAAAATNGEVGSAGNGGESEGKKSQAKGKGAGSIKRRAGDGGDDEGEGTPAKKARGGKRAKKTQATTEDDGKLDDGEAEGAKFKTEGAEDNEDDLVF